MDRRGFMKMAVGGASVIAFSQLFPFPKALAEEVLKMTKTDSEWKKELTAEQYDVLRHEGTERPFTSTLNDEHRKGTFVCAGCNLDLFASETKFNSGTGWPSFYAAIPGHIENKNGQQFVYAADRISLRPLRWPSRSYF